MKSVRKKIFQNFDEHENKSDIVTGTNLIRQSSASYKCRYQAAVTRSHTTTTWRKHTGKIQWYPTLGATVMLGDFTLENTWLLKLQNKEM